MKIHLRVWIICVCFAALISARFRPTTANDGVSNGRIAFASVRDGDSEIYTIKPDGSDLQQLTFNDSYDSFPAWSPDGTRIAYYCDGNLCIMSASGADRIRIENTLGAREPAWSPDGSKLAFEKDDIFVLNLEDLTLFNVTNTPEEIDMNPVWSPNGNRIAYTSSGDNFVPMTVEGNPVMDLYAIDADGTNRSKVSNGGLGFGSLNWMTNDQFIYVKVAFPHAGIYSYSLSNDHELLLTDTSIFSGAPDVSPDEHQIVFVQGSQLAIMDIDGTNLTVITNTDENKFDPHWQPVMATVSDATSDGETSVDG
jgi:Tol biopolymer transport system component